MKKIFFALIVLAMCGLASNAATKYEINVAGTEVTSDNCNYIAASSDNDIRKGYAVYDASKNTLTCYNIDIYRDGSGEYGIHNRKCDNLKIVFKGTCYIGTSDHALNLARGTVLYADEGSSTTVVTGGSRHALNLGSYSYGIQGTGSIYFSGKAAIHGNGSGSTTVSFLDAKVTAAPISTNHVLESFKADFYDDADVRIKSNGSSTSINDVKMTFYWDQAILEPYGAYYKDGTVYNLSGSAITNQDIYISDNYVAILNADYFPDANFRSALLNFYPKGYLISSDTGSRTNLNVTGKNISNLTGIEYFYQLTQLICPNNNLTSLDVSMLTKLTTLSCFNNKLTSLKMPSSVQSLNCSGNQLTSFSMPSSMEWLDCSNNLLTSMPSISSSLTTLYCGNNKFTSLSITGNSALKNLYAQNNTSMTELYCQNNALTTLDVSGCTALKTLFCGSNQLTSLDVSSLSNLLQLECARNKLTSINVSNKTKLKILNVCKNQLTSINVQGCSAMEHLNCYDNVLSSVSVQGCSSLSFINISLNQIKESAMNTLINSLRTIPAGSTGELYVYYEGNDPREGNVITTAQVIAARNKRWIPKKCVNASWVEITVKGDVNGDGKINVSDVTALINMIMGITTMDATVADVNGDGKVNVSDVSALINIILGIG